MPSPLSVSPLAPTRTASSLHRRFLAAVAIGGATAIALVAWGANAAVSLAADGGLTRAQGSVRIAVGVLVGALIALLVALHQFLTRRISGPATELAEAAEKVAAGNFAVELERTTSDDEIGRLTRAVGGMVLELRRLASAIAGSARETTSMSHEITAGSEQMAAAAGQMAQTASELSSQATGMAETIGALAKLATTLRELSATLQEGAQEGVTRNQALRSLANENRSGLDASSTSLGTLGEDVRASAQAVEALGDASQEIRSFVTLVRKLARQSKLLALNAAMEAARAGEHGEGFAVVASEVRRLASMSSDAAERTEQIVNGVLSGIAQSRESAGRAVATAEAVGAATARASESFAEIEQAVVGAEEWSASVERTSAAASELIVDMTTRLDSLASGTESFAAAMEQVAASSQEQSASTEEIAGAAGALASAAERLARIVAGLKLGGDSTAVSPTAAPARTQPKVERASTIATRPTLAIPVTA